MTWGVVVAAAAITIASRMVALVIPGELPEPVRAVLDRLPAPLFGALAVTALLAGDAALDPPVLVAFAAALAVGAMRRSLLLVVVAGLAGFAVGGLLT